MATTLPVTASTIVGRLASSDLQVLTPNNLWDLLGDVDSSVLTSSPQINIDGSTLHFGFGPVAPTDGLVHIQSGTAGTVTASSFADELVIEGAGIIGTSWLTPNTGSAVLAFADPESSLAAFFQYVHTSDTLTFDIGSIEYFRISSSGFTINEAATSTVDFRAESANSQNMFFVDASADRVGIGLSSLTPTDGLLHIQSGTAGTVTASTSFDELVIEVSTTNGGMSFLHSDTVTGNGITWSTPTQQFRCQVIHDPADNEARLAYSNVNILSWSNNPGIVINKSGSATVDFRVESDTITDMFFVDAGNEQVNINNTTAIASGLGNLNIGNGTSPTAVLANGISIGSKDSGAGGTLAVPELWIEEPPEVIGTFTASHKFKIWINGTEYFIQLDAV